MVDKIIIHCSALDYGTIKGIREYHQENKGWSDIGYHYVIENGYQDRSAFEKHEYALTKDGQIFRGRDEKVIGAHVKGHNRESIGICLVGNKVFSASQLASLCCLTVSLCFRYSLLANQVFGHYEFDEKKTCPNLDMKRIRSRVRTLLSNVYMQAGC